MGKDDFSKIPNGHPAIEHRIELLYSEGVKKGKITLNKMVEVACTNPAKIFGLFPKKGTIAVGSDADIVIFNPKTKHELSAKTHPHEYRLFSLRRLESSRQSRDRFTEGGVL